MLRKHNEIIGKFKSKYWVITHKIGVKITKSVAEENSFDEDNDNTCWWYVICKEMNNVCP